MWAHRNHLTIRHHGRMNLKEVFQSQMPQELTVAPRRSLQQTLSFSLSISWLQAQSRSIRTSWDSCTRNSAVRNTWWQYRSIRYFDLYLVDCRFNCGKRERPKCEYFVKESWGEGKALIQCGWRRWTRGNVDSRAIHRYFHAIWEQRRGHWVCDSFDILRSFWCKQGLGHWSFRFHESFSTCG